MMYSRDHIGWGEGSGIKPGQVHLFTKVNALPFTDSVIDSFLPPIAKILSHLKFEFKNLPWLEKLYSR